jgi:hypothetical protein
MDEVVQEQMAIKGRIESVLARIESSITPSDDGTLGLGIKEDEDAELLQQLVESLEQTNQFVAEGELALSDVSLTTEGVAIA